MGLPQPPEGFNLLAPPELPAPPEGFNLLKPPVQRKDQNFFERFGGDLQVRFGAQGSEIIDAYVNEDQNFVHTATQLAGKVGAGSVMDLIGEVLVSGGRGLSNITPDMIEDPLMQGATKAGVMFLNTDVGKAGMEAALKGAYAWSEYKESNPVSARTIEAVVNIGLLITPVKAKPKPGGVRIKVPDPRGGGKPPLYSARPGEALAGKLDASAAKSVKKSQDEFLLDLVKPAQTKKVKKQNISRTTVEPALVGSKNVIRPTSNEIKAAVELRSVSGVSPKKTLQGNWNAVQSAVRQKSNALVNSLKGLGNKGKYNWDEFTKAVDDNLKLALKDEPELVGDAVKSAEKVIQKALKLAKANDQTLAGLLKTRKELDIWVRARKPGALENGPVSNAMTTAVRGVRTEINKFIAARAHSVRVTKSLDSQSTMLRAMDDIGDKALKEADTTIKRMMQSAIKLIPLRNEIVAGMGLLFAVGGLGAAAMFVPFVQKLLITAGIWMGAKGAVMSPATRQGIASMIRTIDRGIKLSTDPKGILVLRGHRAALVELLDNSTVEETKRKEE